MNGILLVDKPSGWTSNDVVQKLRGILKERRIGHAGTLDPLATGLLTVFVGRATRAVEYAEGDRKRYTAALRLGMVTDTLDITGTVLKEQPVPAIAEQDFLAVLDRFHGPQMQIPPMYSAVKVNGRRLYQLARRGEEAERKPRRIEIFSLELKSFHPEEAVLDICCSKGTYIRSLCHDIGTAIGCGACMSALRRTEAGFFNVENACTLEQIAAGDYCLLPVESLFSDCPAANISVRDEYRLRNGQTFASELPDGRYRLYGNSGEFLALAEVLSGQVQIKKRFYEVTT